MRWLISALHMWRVGWLFTSRVHHGANGMTPLVPVGEPTLSLKFCILFCIVRFRSIRFNLLGFFFTSFRMLAIIWSDLEFFKYIFLYHLHRIEVTMTCSSGVSAPL